MLYKEPRKRHGLSAWLRLSGLHAVNARRRRTDIDLLELSPHLQRDLGLIDSGWPH